jgi:uncharacterized repeat protein (TIGR01451 family)
MKTSKYLIVLTLTALFMMIAATPAGAQSAANYDLTTDPSGLGSATINDAIWEIFQSSDPTGSGVFYSFLRVQQTPTERGYNTDGRKLQFDENTSASFTHSFHLHDVPQVDIGGTIYREFQLDLNEKNSDPDWYISLDSFQVWTTNDPDLLGYTEGTPSGTFPIGDTLGHALLVYDLDGAGDTWIKMDYRANNGSGKRDYRVFVPQSYFEGKELYYVVLFTRHGAQGGDWISDSGYEEWGVAQYPAIKSGYKFNDENGNGIWDEGEPGLNGWTINLVGESVDDKGHTHAVSMSTVTANDGEGNPGYYSFSVLQGNYTVSEVLQPGWAQTLPGGDGTYVISLGNGQLEYDNDFGNVQYAPDISINKSADIDEFCLSDVPVPVTYTYLVENTGNEPLENVDVTDDTCSSPTYQSGDDGSDNILSPGEIWTYECTTVLNDTTTNTADVVAYGVYTGTEVSDEDTATVTANDLDVTVDPTEATICESGEQEFCATPSSGSGNYSYSWTLDDSPLVGEVSDCITVSTAGQYCVTVHDEDTGCEATACAMLYVTTPPVCSITGPTSVCDTDVEVGFCSLNSADIYSWSIDEGGDAEIVSGTDGDCVLVTPTGPGSFTLRLLVCNGPVELNCCSECTLNVTVNPCTPGIHVVKYPDIDYFCLSDVPVQVTYTYEVTANGTEPLENVSIEDDTCFDPAYVSGDDGDNILELGETWIYTCSTSLYDTTTNTVDVAGFGVFSGNEVTDETTATVTAYDLDVEVTPADSEICEGGDPVHLCVNIVTPGSGDYSYLWSTGETTECIDVDTTGTYSVTVTDNVYGCEDTAEATLNVIDVPDCSIEGPSSLCVGDEVQFCASVSDAYSYEWVIALGEEYAEIVGDTTGNCVTVRATGEGTFRLALSICNAGDVIMCCDECSTDVLVESCGGAFCSFTQGFWGNPGGTGCDPGVTTTDLLIALLEGDPVVVGQPGVRSITFDTADCILLRLPAGGPPKALPPSLGDAQCDNLPNSLLYDDGRIKNVLVGQVVALTLNLRLYPGCLEDSADLGSFVLPEGPFCTVPYNNQEACVKHFEIPEELQGMTVNQLLEEANAALAGDTTYKISDIYDAVTSINEGFDECRIIVPCIRPEICDNGCDDDGDGLVDTDDPDCIVIVPTI